MRSLRAIVVALDTPARISVCAMASLRTCRSRDLRRRRCTLRRSTFYARWPEQRANRRGKSRVTAQAKGSAAPSGMTPRGKGYRLAQTSIRKAFMPMRTRMRTHRAYESCSCIFHAAIQDTNRHKAAKNQKHSSRSIFHKRNLPMVGVCQLHRLVMRLRPAESSRGLSRRPVGAYARNSAQASGSFRVNAASTFLLGASYGRLHELGGPRSITFDQ
jgi:hypothetical protein